MEEKPQPVSLAAPAAALAVADASLRKLAREHPLIFGACSVGSGVGAIMLAPQVLAIGQAVALLGVVMLCIGMASAVLSEDKEQGPRLAAAGTMVMLAGLGISLAAFLMTAAGAVAVAGGSGVALKAGAEEVLRWRIRRQMKERNLGELLALSHQLDG